ncbi:alginate export family protein [Flavobacterium sp. GSA192]|uniref:alginate export family protein n=1 Tax=Flavobacterium sp. GSA192 TaxID=2576304 RepID=UPI00112E6B10|nr:alginate export family protein [Flavobacterium sp. GSA192]
MKLLKTLSLSIIGLVGTGAMAQEFSSDIQIRPRYEYTNGFGTLLTPTTEHTSFVGNRARLNLNYKDEKLAVKLALQNVRTWGAVNHLTGGVSNATNSFVLFEGWAQYSFTDKWSTKVGRQVISYDNQRIFGGLDWANQGRSFDAALFKYKGAKSQLDLGFALNAKDETKTTLSFPTSVSFKNDLDFKDFQYAWYHTSIKKLGVSFLALNIGREYMKTLTEAETNYYQTFGTYANYAGKKLSLDFSFYGQTGKIETNKVSAWQTAANLGYAFSPKFKATLGYEFLSGKDLGTSPTMVKSFNPVFGTNHAFNGFMDYFYVGNHANSVGLQDLTLKLDFPIKKVNLSVAPHLFYTANELTATDDKYLGTEVDVTAVYKASKDITLIAGYSQMFGSDSMVALKGGLNDTTNNWAYLMVNINPQIFSSKK